MNNYSTIGRLTREPETKLLPTGKSVTSFGIAQDIGFGDNKKTLFWDCKLWGVSGENFAKYVYKGHQVGIEARMDQEEWNDKATGEARKKLVLVVNNFTLLSNGEKAQGQQQDKPAASARPSRQAPPAPASPPADDLDNGDDIPF